MAKGATATTKTAPPRNVNTWRKLKAAMPPEHQARMHARTAKLVAEMPLNELRQARHLSQETLAKVLGQGQASVSKIERRTDMYVSTLRGMIEAMGGRLDIIARFPDGDVRINQFGEVGVDA